jgi:ABC-type uncharacterized transport system YnjBCD substrate-binding protein
MLKNFKEFLLEQEEEHNSDREDDSSKKEETPKTKEIGIGKTADGTKVMAQMKLENTLKFSSEEFTKLQNMRVTQYDRDMLTHMRGEKEYKVSKDKHGKCTIWHLNQTLHKLMPVGAFQLPQKIERESED